MNRSPALIPITYLERHEKNGYEWFESIKIGSVYTKDLLKFKNEMDLIWQEIRR